MSPSVFKVFWRRFFGINLVKRSFHMTINSNLSDSQWMTFAKQAVPILQNDKHKGQDGRIGIIGGSEEYTGAPYFAGISALKVGADLVHVFCARAAAPVIKSYSPELIVHPLLDSDTEQALQEMAQWLQRIHVLVIGPGLGRDPRVFQNISHIIQHCQINRKPLVIDADGLFFINDNLHLLKNYPYPGVILTPNKIEFERLYEKIKKSNAKEDAVDIDYDKLGKNVLILRKGSVDTAFSNTVDNIWSIAEGGSARRCGGQGDLLSGSLATFFNWSIHNIPNYEQSMLPAAVAGYAAATLTRRCNQKAFFFKGRSMVCSDMIEKIHEAFDDLFEA